MIRTKKNSEGCVTFQVFSVGILMHSVIHYSFPKGGFYFAWIAFSGQYLSFWTYISVMQGVYVYVLAHIKWIASPQRLLLTFKFYVQSLLYMG